MKKRLLSFLLTGSLLLTLLPMAALAEDTAQPAEVGTTNTVEAAPVETSTETPEEDTGAASDADAAPQGEEP